MKFCASYQVQCWQTVLCSEIANFLNPQTVRGDASALVSSGFFFILYFLYQLILNMLSIGSSLHSASRNLLSTVSRKSTRVTWLIIKRWEITQGSKQRFDFPCTSSNLRLAQWLQLFLPDVDNFWVHLFIPNSSRFLKSPLTQAAWTLELTVITFSFSHKYLSA